MSELLPCRWRDARDAGALWCHSDRFVAPPNRVTAEFCRTCYYRDSAPVQGLPPCAARLPPDQTGLAVATLYTAEVADYGRPAAELIWAYARWHGYGAVVVTETLDPSRPPVWSKLLLVERYLRETPACRWLLWIDADAVITNPAQRLEDLIDEEADFLVAEDIPPSPINLGVFLARNCPAVLDLLRRAYAKVGYAHRPMWEQSATAEALRESGAGLRTRIVPRRLFNSFAGEHRAGDFILHFAGCAREAKVAGVQRAILDAWTRTWGSPVSGEMPPQPASLDLAHTVFLAGCVLSKKPERVLELGIGPGYCSWALVRALAYNRKGRLTCVDSWCDWHGREPEHIAALRRAGVEVVVRTEEEFVRSCPAECFDVLVSDADHGRSEQWLDEQLRIVKPGGFLFFHDTNNPEFPNLAVIVARVARLPHYHFTESSRPDEACARGFLFVIKR